MAFVLADEDRSAATIRDEIRQRVEVSRRLRAAPLISHQLAVQALERDEFLNFNNLADDVMRSAYKRIYDAYQPGPVMDFNHFPEHFAYYDPEPTTAWRAEFASAGAVPDPATDKFRGLKASGPGVTVTRVSVGEHVAQV